MSEDTETIDKEWVMRVVALNISASFVVGAVVLAPIDDGWFLVAVGGAIVFLLLESAIKTDGTARWLFNIVPGLNYDG